MRNPSISGVRGALQGWKIIVDVVEKRPMMGDTKIGRFGPE
jgi:hypothetical protein